MKLAFVLIVICCLLLVAVFVVTAFRAERRSVTRRASNFAQYKYTDDLGKSILSLIDDVYSPFYEPHLSDHLVSDLGLDSLDMVDLIFDCSCIAGVELNAHDLFHTYGRNPTISQLILYIRSMLSNPS